MNYLNNLDTFSKSKINNKYHQVEAKGQDVSSSRIVPSYIIPVQNVKYIRYSVPNATNSLNLLVESSDNASVFPRNIYKKEPMASLSPSLEGFRDKTLLYTYSSDPVDCKERSTHTIASSRFGYNRFPETYEYGLGMQSSGYVEPTKCHSCANDTPKNMAPQIYYMDYHLRNTPTELRKMINQRPIC
jgi:hypothetical protein